MFAAKRKKGREGYVLVMISNLAIFPREKNPEHCLSDEKKIAYNDRLETIYVLYYVINKLQIAGYT